MKVIFAITPRWLISDDIGAWRHRILMRGGMTFGYPCFVLFQWGGGNLKSVYTLSWESEEKKKILTQHRHMIQMYQRGGRDIFAYFILNGGNQDRESIMITNWDFLFFLPPTFALDWIPQTHTQDAFVSWFLFLAWPLFNAWAAL